MCHVGYLGVFGGIWRWCLGVFGVFGETANSSAYPQIADFVCFGPTPLVLSHSQSSLLFLTTTDTTTTVIIAKNKQSETASLHRMASPSTPPSRPIPITAHGRSRSASVSSAGSPTTPGLSPGASSLSASSIQVGFHFPNFVPSPSPSRPP